MLFQLRPLVLEIAKCFLGNADDAHDVSQNTLIELSTRLPNIRDAASLTAIVRTTTVHQCVDFRRRRATRRVPGPSWDEASLIAEEREIAARLVIDAAVAALPTREQEALLLDWLGDLKHAEIAVQIGVSVPTVRARLQAAKRSLRKQLGSIQANPNMQLEPTVQQLVNQAFPHALVESVQSEPEMWLPYQYRLRLESEGIEHVVDVRTDVDAGMAALMGPLAAAGIPMPQLIVGPTTVVGKPWSLWRAPVRAKPNLMDS